MKEELLLLVLSFIVLAMVSLLGHKQVNDKPKTKVVELTHKAFFGKKVYPVLSHHLDLDHTVLICDTVPIKGVKPKNKKLKDMVDLKIDTNKLIELLD